MNSVHSVTVTYLVRPLDKLLAFGLGIYGLVMLAGIVALILRDPV